MTTGGTCQPVVVSAVASCSERDSARLLFRAKSGSPAQDAEWARLKGKSLAAARSPLRKLIAGREHREAQVLDRAHGKGDLEQPQSGRQAGGRNSKTRGSLSQPRNVDPRAPCSRSWRPCGSGYPPVLELVSPAFFKQDKVAVLSQGGVVLP